MLITCPECGKQISDKALSCPNCGLPLNQAAAEVVTDTPQKEEPHIYCPKCGSSHVLIQREQTGSVGVAQNSVTIEQPKVRHGCLYWITVGWIGTLFYWICIGWWYRPLRALFGRRKKKGHNFSAEKTISKTTAVCQNCGYNWKV